MVELCNCAFFAALNNWRLELLLAREGQGSRKAEALIKAEPAPPTLVRTFASCLVTRSAMQEVKTLMGRTCIRKRGKS